MARQWTDDVRMRRRSVGPVNVRALVWVLAALLVASATGGVYVLSSVHTAAPARPATLRIMPLGDATTVGVDGTGRTSGGWRPLLKQRLVAAEHLDVRFVGRQTVGSPPQDPLPHEGYDGGRIDEVRKLVDGAMAAAVPDVVLLQIGTDDIRQRHALDSAPARLRDLAARVCADRVGVVVAVASIIPVRGLESLVDRFDAAIPATVAGLQRSGCDARFVDMRNVVAAGARPDGVHPDRAGYAALAAAWYPVVRDAYDQAEAPGAGSIDDDVLDYTGHWTHDHDRAGAYRADEHHSGSTGDTVSWLFRGTGIELRGATGPAGGIAAVSIDGGAGVPVDFYASTAAEQTVVYRSTALKDTTHLISVRVTGDRAAASAGSTVSVDRLLITGRGA